MCSNVINIQENYFLFKWKSAELLIWTCFKMCVMAAKMSVVVMDCVKRCFPWCVCDSKSIPSSISCFFLLQSWLQFVSRVYDVPVFVPLHVPCSLSRLNAYTLFPLVGLVGRCLSRSRGVFARLNPQVSASFGHELG